MGTPDEIEAAHAEMRRLYCVNKGGQSLAFILALESETRAARANLYRLLGRHV